MALMFGAIEDMTMEQRIEIALTQRCVMCKNRVKYQPCDKDTTPGAIYSHAGCREMAISGICEACFDKIMGG